jgi:hypothetical protein
VSLGAGEVAAHPGRGFLQAGAAVTQLGGPAAALEAGWRLRPGLGLYGTAAADARGWGAGAGLRWEF